jgi:hypothetical protein
VQLLFFNGFLLCHSIVFLFIALITIGLYRVIEDCKLQLGVSFDSSRATAAQAATVEHESDRP